MFVQYHSPYVRGDVKSLNGPVLSSVYCLLFQLYVGPRTQLQQLLVSVAVVKQSQSCLIQLVSHFTESQTLLVSLCVYHTPFLFSLVDFAVFRSTVCLFS